MIRNCKITAFACTAVVLAAFASAHSQTPSPSKISAHLINSYHSYTINYTTDTSVEFYLAPTAPAARGDGAGGSSL